ncbi:dsDNA nuclease domain-containing protein [Streptomyces antimycoticus]|uniref:dsDNA nuclease domain-containing protein n=1 Tax=Streptomyces antimycoticus TaxID=68175 RepID=UPI0037D1AA62
MADPINTKAPDDSGSVTLERYEYQVHVAVQGVLRMLSGEPVRHVTCEHIEDIVVASANGGSLAADLVWDFQQIKTKDAPEPWTLATVISKKPLRSLWRTYMAIRSSGIACQLTGGLEGHLDPGDASVMALSRGQGAEDESCLKRVASHLKADEGQVAAFLPLVRLIGLPNHSHLEDRNMRFLGGLNPQLSVTEVNALYLELLRRTRDAMQGKLGSDRIELLTSPDPDERVRRKRIDAARIADLQQRLCRPDHVLLGDVSAQLTGVETALVRKMRTGAASPDVIEDAQKMRAHADFHRMERQALGTWPANDAVANDVDQRLLFAARMTVRRHRVERPSPADAIYDALYSALTAEAATIDRHPLYAGDNVLLLGRAFALSDECHFDWGDVNEPSA